MARQKGKKLQQKAAQKQKQNTKTAVQEESENEESQFENEEVPKKNNKTKQSKTMQDDQKQSNKRKSDQKLSVSSSKIEVLKKKIKRTMSNLSEKENKDEMEAEKVDETLQDNMITYSLDPSENIITIKIQKRSYQFNTTSEFVKENNSLIEFIDGIDKYFDLLKKKESRKCDEIQKLTNHYQFTAIEYYLMKTFDDIEAKQKSTPNTHCEDEKCCICQFELYDDILSYKPSDFVHQLTNDQDSDAIGLIDCDGHYFHKECLKMMAQSTYIKCPICSKIYGVMMGDQPDGDMTIETCNVKCSGYKCKTIVINYSMHGGQINGKYVPGTYRTAYLPDNEEGREVRDLLKVAFDRKLIFTIGRSVTTGMDNQIVWNGIHHKTSTSGGSAYFGWPDPTYFNRVKQELALKGVR